MSNLSFQQLASVFNLPLPQAAQELNIGCTALKRACRKNNIPKWPFRRLRSLDRILDALRANLEAATSDVEKERLKLDLMYIENQRTAILRNPRLLATSRWPPQNHHNDMFVMKTSFKGKPATPTATASTKPPHTVNHLAALPAVPPSAPLQPSQPQHHQHQPRQQQHSSSRGSSRDSSPLSSPLMSPGPMSPSTSPRSNVQPQQQIPQQQYSQKSFHAQQPSHQLMYSTQPHEDTTRKLIPLAPKPPMPSRNFTQFPTPVHNQPTQQQQQQHSYHQHLSSVPKSVYSQPPQQQQQQQQSYHYPQHHHQQQQQPHQYQQYAQHPQAPQQFPQHQEQHGSFNPLAAPSMTLDHEIAGVDALATFASLMLRDARQADLRICQQSSESQNNSSPMSSPQSAYSDDPMSPRQRCDVVLPQLPQMNV